MNNQKSLNNKGFSLVELIIVIAIMAILVGVMAPQLMKYVERSRVSADTQLADTVKTAVTTAMLDPEVMKDTNYAGDLLKFKTRAELSTMGTNVFGKAVAETLGETTIASTWAATKLKSKDAVHIYVTIHETTKAVTVEVTKTDGTAVSPAILIK